MSQTQYGMPSAEYLTNDEGNVIEYFGIARNITDLMDAQQKLKEETARQKTPAG